MDEERDALAELPSASVGERANARNMCYIIFTSGSTGRPKGAVLQHDSAVNFLHLSTGAPVPGCLPDAGMNCMAGLLPLVGAGRWQR